MEKIEVKSINFGYSSDHIILKDTSFKIRKGEYVSILGHNGSGKSTLSKLLIGLLFPNSGEIKIDGEILSENNASTLRQKMALVFQNPDNQFVGATVSDDVAFGLENRNVSHDEMQPIIDKFIKMVGMEKFEDKEPSNLSGGQKQRVAIASALALSPEILILDEATSMLDPKGKKEINDLIKTLKKENPELTIISITHDVNEALFSDRVLILSSGSIILSGKPEEIFSNPEIISKNNLIRPFIYKVKDGLKNIGYDVDGCSTIDDLVEAICR